MPWESVWTLMDGVTRTWVSCVAVGCPWESVRVTVCGVDTGDGMLVEVIVMPCESVVVATTGVTKVGVWGVWDVVISETVMVPTSPWSEDGTVAVMPSEIVFNPISP